MPVLFCCEDNGFGISVRTPRDWVSEAWSNRPHLRYFSAEGTDIAAAYDAALAAAEYVRSTRRPAFLHLRCVRFLGHAGSDAEVGYRSRAEIGEDLERDPLVHAARLLAEAGIAEPSDLLARYDAVAADVRRLADDAANQRRLSSASEVMEPLARRRPETVASDSSRAASPDARANAFAGKLPEEAGPLTLAESINATLTDALAARPEVLVFGEDVGRKGGVYGVTRGLQRRFGITRVFDTLLDEQTILGVALGCGVSGLLPVPEIQYLAYLHNAEDQLRGEAATLPFFSNGQYHNPMVLRIAGYGYQKGFGGHFHNDDAVAVLRDIPGIVVASPARPDDAAAMLRACVAAASVDGSACVFLEPIALYHTRDLHSAGDGGWVAPYPAPSEWSAAHAPIGSARVHGDGSDLTIVTFANGTYMSLRVAQRLADDGIDVRVVDLRWLAPLPVADILREAEATGRVLIVDETRRSGGVSEGVVGALVDANFEGTISRVTSQDSFIPLGEAADHVLLQEAEIDAAARALVERLGDRHQHVVVHLRVRLARQHLACLGGEEGVEGHVLLADEARVRQRALGKQLDHPDRPRGCRPCDGGPGGAGDDPRPVHADELLAGRASSVVSLGRRVDDHQIVPDRRVGVREQPHGLLSLPAEAQLLQHEPHQLPVAGIPDRLVVEAGRRVRRRFRTSSRGRRRW